MSRAFDSPAPRVQNVTRAPSGEKPSVRTEGLTSSGTLPRVDRAVEETQRTMRTLTRAVNGLSENPQALIFGDGREQPGPGEPGFRPPGERR